MRLSMEISRQHLSEATIFRCERRPWVRENRIGNSSQRVGYLRFYHSTVGGIRKERFNIKIITKQSFCFRPTWYTVCTVLTVVSDYCRYSLRTRLTELP